MIHVKDLFRLQGVTSLRLVAGQSGLQRAIRAAVLFEYNEERMRLNDFYRGDLVLSTLAYAREDTDLVSESLLALMRQKVGALMIKTGYHATLPEIVLEEADRTGTPLFLFDESYIEEVLIEVTELIRSRRHFSGYEKDIDELMRGGLGSDQIRERVRRIDPSWGSPARICSIAAGAQMQQLSEKLYHLIEDEETDCVFMAWHFLLLALIHPRKEDENEFAQIEEVLRQTGMETDSMLIGASSLCETPERLGFALCEAVHAARAAELTHQKRMRTDDLGVYAYLLPMSRNVFVSDYCRGMLGRLREYDYRNNASIEQTAVEYIRQGRQIPATAKALYQHPNTVRYRLGKIRRLMRIEDEASFDMMLEFTVRLSGVLESTAKE